MAGHWGLFQRRGWHLLSLATSPWDRVCASVKLFPWEAGFLPNGPQARCLGGPSGSPEYRDEVRGLDHAWAMLFLPPGCVAFC